MSVNGFYFDFNRFRIWKNIQPIFEVSIWIIHFIMLILYMLLNVILWLNLFLAYLSYLAYTTGEYLSAFLSAFLWLLFHFYFRNEYILFNRFVDYGSYLLLRCLGFNYSSLGGLLLKLLGSYMFLSFFWIVCFPFAK